jgi:MoxR-like ATPase
LLTVQAGGGTAGDEDVPSVFGEEFLLERPLLRAVRGHENSPPVLLIDEIDRADEEFEAFLLEFLSDFQVTIPELGTVQAANPPIVVITSNRTRGLSDALKRRCLYLHIEPPEFDRELDIVRRKVPQLEGAVVSEVVGIVQRLRDEPLLKQPGVAETLDWANAIAALRADGDEDDISNEEIRNTLSTLLKEVEDIRSVDDELLEELREAAIEARDTGAED